MSLDLFNTVMVHRGRYLNNNEIDGTLPKAWWLGKFVVLALANNRIGGTLPLNWKNMEHIEVIDLSHNRLSGVLPAARPLSLGNVVSDVSHCEGMVYFDKTKDSAAER